MHTTTPIFHGGGLARFGAARSGPASGGGVGLIQGGWPIGGFVWVHGVSNFLCEGHPRDDKAMLFIPKPFGYTLGFVYCEKNKYCRASPIQIFSYP